LDSGDLVRGLGHSAARQCKRHADLYKELHSYSIF
jgi:hypothetical protein